MKIKSGTRIRWQYIHHLNGKSRVNRIKFGVYLRKVYHSERWNGKPLAIVQFNGNKHVSKVPIEELKQYPSGRRITSG
jgi:hypothetical protein